MLVNFRVKNYRSFMNEALFSMESAKITAANKELDNENVFEKGKLSLLKSAAIYGANASGKSNLIKSIAFFCYFISDTIKTRKGIEVERFLLSDALEQEPVAFEMTFFVRGTRYRYGFELDEEKVHSEWLYYVPEKRETLLFLREDEAIELKSRFKEAEGLQKRTRNDTLFLSVCAQFNVSIAIEIVTWFGEGILGVSGIDIGALKKDTVEFLQNTPSIASASLDLMRSMDLGIQGFFFNDGPPMIWSQAPWHSSAFESKESAWSNETMKHFLQTPYGDIETVHQKYSSNGDIIGNILLSLERHESDGTQKLFVLVPIVLRALSTGQLLIIDEIDARLHPTMVKSLIQLFNSSKTNPNNAQLIFTTHNSGILDKNILRRDQIWFTEKDKIGATQLYSLAEYRVRNDASFEKDYMRGKYGATPYLDDMSEVVKRFHG